MKIEPILRIFIFISVMFFAACSKEIPSNPAIKKAEPTSSICPNGPKILHSTSKFIKIDHAMSQFEEANKIAVSWCEQFNLNSDFSTQKCDKCCESNFQCR